MDEINTLYIGEQNQVLTYNIQEINYKIIYISLKNGMQYSMILKINDNDYTKNFNAINENFNKVILILPIESILTVSKQKEYINNIEIIKNYIESRGKFFKYKQKEDLTKGINDYITQNVNFHKSKIEFFEDIIYESIIKNEEYEKLGKNINTNKKNLQSKKDPYQYMMKYILNCESFIEEIYSITLINEINIRKCINENIKINIYYE